MLGGGGGGVRVRGDRFPMVKILADEILVFTHCFSGFWPVEIGFGVRWRLLVWVVRLFRVVLGVMLDVYLDHCVWCFARDCGSAC